MAVLLDATVVRLLLVPATMEPLGDRNWWLPGWLDRILPVVHVEPAAAESTAACEPSAADGAPSPDGSEARPQRETVPRQR